jgi:uncharacterized protein (DUF2235 family)
VKRLIVCCDGTWNRADQETHGTLCPTNVVKIAFRIAKRDGAIPQIVYYDQGVGTGNRLDRVTGGAFGHGLEDNMHRAYRFLVANYEPGDELFLFGFSRGAFTARSTAGLIRKCGLLTKSESHRFPEAYALYRNRDAGADTPEAVRFRAQHSIEVQVTCLGVWDTVGSLGIPGHLGGTVIGRAINRNFEFHDVKISSKTVRAAYQALAIDEERGPFAPAIWWREHVPDQVLQQAWFPGCHSDVGGGNTPWDEAARDGCLSDVALEWMVGRAAQHGLEFDARYLRERLFPNPFAPVHHSRTGIYSLMAPFNRELLAMPDDPALRTAIERRRSQYPGDDPVAYPPPLEWPQEIHESVRQRVEQDRSYRRPSLLRHLE